MPPQSQFGVFSLLSVPDTADEADLVRGELDLKCYTEEAGFDFERHRSYLADVRETLPVYEELRIAHPGYLLRTANWILADHVVLGPWIHVGSQVTNLGLATDGSTIRTQGSVRDSYERKGHLFVELDLLVTADDRAVAHIDHTAIYRPRQVAEAS